MLNVVLHLKNKKKVEPPCIYAVFRFTFIAEEKTVMIKKRVIVDYKNVPEEVLQALAEKYPHGYTKAIIRFTNAKNEMVSAVPIELGDTAYLVKVSTQLQKMVDDFDLDDFDDLGIEAEGKGNKGFSGGDSGFDDEFSNDDDSSGTGYEDEDDDLEDSMEDHLDEAEGIADDGGDEDY